MTPTTPSPSSDQAAGDTREARLENLMSVLDVFIAKQDEEWRYANRDLTMAFVDVVFAKDTAPTTGSAPVAWLVTGGKTFVDKPFLTEAWADKSIAERKDSARKVPLYDHPASPAASVLTDEQIRHLRKALAVLNGTGHYDEAGTITAILAASMGG